METALTWAEVDLDAIAHNISALRQLTSPPTRFMAVVKANAYGHGAVAVAWQALAAGADWLGVARLEEGVQLRQAGIRAPILIFGYTPPEAAGILLANDLTATVYSFETAKAYSEAAGAAGHTLKVHLKVDTGMGRLGLMPEVFNFSPTGKAVSGNPVFAVEAIAHLPGIELEGVYTHFPAADQKDKNPTLDQLEKFTDFLDHLHFAGLSIPIRHAANSAALMEMPETHFDMVRCGIALYGLYPSDEVDRSRVALKPAMTLKTRVVHVKSVPAGFHVSYGMTYTTEQPTVIATVGAGYADGLSRRFSSAGQMLVGGRRAPIAGRICMDMCMLDAGPDAQIDVGDEAVIFGRQAEAELSADEVARILGTINYEVVTTVGARVPRVHLNARAESQLSVD